MVAEQTFMAEQHHHSTEAEPISQKRRTFRVPPPEIRCNCGALCAVRSSQTPKNPNRWFYKCTGKEGCNYFKWCDELQNVSPTRKEMRQPNLSNQERAYGTPSPKAASDSCFGCGQRGHWVKDCPLTKSSPEPKSVSSFPCFRTPNSESKAAAVSSMEIATPEPKAEHETYCNFKIPSPQLKSLSGACFTCKQHGHWANNCPLRAEGVPTEPKSMPGACLKSPNSESRAMFFAIPESKAETGKENHSANDCTLEKSTTEHKSGPNACFKTVSTSESESVSFASFECSKPEPEPEPKLRSNRDRCYNCQQEGHWAANCPRKSSTPTCQDKILPQLPPLLCKCKAGICPIRVSGSEKNPGRLYYSCPNNNKVSPGYNNNKVSPGYNNNKSRNGCGFLKFCDEYEGLSAKISSSISRLDLKSDDIDDATEILNRASKLPWCACQAGPCRLLICDEGENKGLKYYVCPIRQGDGSCGYFRWFDEEDPCRSPPTMTTNDSTSKDRETFS